MGGPRLQPWGTRITLGFDSPTSKEMGHPNDIEVGHPKKVGHPAPRSRSVYQYDNPTLERLELIYANEGPPCRAPLASRPFAAYLRMRLP